MRSQPDQDWNSERALRDGGQPQARMAHDAGGQPVREFIEQIYNPVRLHSALAYQSPMEFERDQEQEKRNAECGNDLDPGDASE